MDRIFRIDFYPADWLVKTGGLTPEECGFYIQIVALIYCHRGPIENDPSEISRKLKGCSSRLAKSIIKSLCEKGKITVQDGFITNSRAEIELNKKRTHLEDSSNGGRTKAENERRRKENKELSSSEGTYPQATPSPSPSPSPSFTLPLSNKSKYGGAPCENAQGATRSKKASRISEEWELPTDWGRWAMGEHDVTRDEVIRQADLFKNYWISKPGKGGQKLDWKRTWENWIIRHKDFKK